jgi:hypothetical protein
VLIWIVDVDGALYVRSYRGFKATSYRHAIEHPAGTIQAADGQQTDVTFTHIGVDRCDLLDAVGAAYRAKYARYGDHFLTPMLAENARAATLRLAPQH